MILKIAIFFIFLYPICLMSQVSTPNEISAFFSKEQIKLDGVLNEAVWDGAKYIYYFTQRELNVGEEVILNFRMHLIPKIGADFFFIVNQTYDTYSSKWRLARTTVVGKLIWCFLI